MGPINNQKRRRSQDQINGKLKAGRSFRRSWIRGLWKDSKVPSLSSNKTAESLHSSMADVSGERELPRTPSPLLTADSAIGQAGPNRNKANYNDDKHLLPLSASSSITFSTPSSSLEKESEAYFTCPSSPVLDSVKRFSALPETPTKMPKRPRKQQQQHSETLVKRMAANHRLHEAFKEGPMTEVTGGYLADPIPIMFPRRQSPKMNKTDFESYLERALFNDSTETNDDNVKDQHQSL